MLHSKSRLQQADKIKSEIKIEQLRNKRRALNYVCVYFENNPLSATYRLIRYGLYLSS